MTFGRTAGSPVSGSKNGVFFQRPDRRDSRARRKRPNAANLTFSCFCFPSGRGTNPRVVTGPNAETSPVILPTINPAKGKRAVWGVVASGALQQLAYHRSIPFGLSFMAERNWPPAVISISSGAIWKMSTAELNAVVADHAAGDFEKAIGAYNYALEIHPKFWEAVEYRGEAFLALGYLDYARQAYMQLFRADRELAAQLMSAMDAWLAEQPEDDEQALAMAAWMDQRKALARMSNDLSMNNTRDW